ncbi:MAG: hypothetical protein KC561_01380 [Myxococcales bacterium]|nr:hypothetical protein [Myxococcales bacterium]
MSNVQTVHFNAIPRPAREAFVRAVEQGQGPQVLHRQVISSRGSAIWRGFLVLIAGGALGVLAIADLGSLYNGLQDQGFIAAYAACLFLVLAAIFGHIGASKRRAALPYTPGLYLFPGVVVDARKPTFKIMPMSSLKDFKGVHQHYNGVYSFTLLSFTFEGGKASFNVRGKDKANRLLVSIDHARATGAASSPAGNPFAGHGIDPLAMDGSAQLSGQPEEPWAHPFSFFAKRPKTIALLLAIALAYPAWMVRNSLSDSAMLAKAREVGRSSSFEAYIWAGGREAESVSQNDLPAAVLAEAQNPPSASALREYLATYPEHSGVPEARARLQELYEEGAATFRASAANNPDAVAFIERLLTWLGQDEQGVVAVRFGPPTQAYLQAIDARLAGMGNVAPIAPHFTTSAVSERETLIAQHLEEAFDSILPNDLLTLEVGAPLSETGGTERPEIRVHYEVGDSSVNYTLTGSTRQFVGIVITFDVEMFIPDGGAPLQFRFAVEPPDHFTVYETQSYGDPTDGTVYTVMANRAFDSLSTRLQYTFFALRVGAGGK